MDNKITSSFKNRRKGFFCPMSPSIPWGDWGLIYKECPLDKFNRDMDECANCKLRGDAPKPKKRKVRKRKNSRNKTNKKTSK